MKKLLLTLSLLATLSLIPARAALTSTGPFVGLYSEYWESFSSVTLSGTVPIMGGAATFTAPSESVFSITSMGVNASPNITGQALYRNTDRGGPATITFNTAVNAFGAYWRRVPDPQFGGDYAGDTVVTFFDSTGAQIGDAQSFNSIPTEAWMGWQSDVGIKSLTIDSTVGEIRNEMFVDGLQAGLQAVPVPELSTWLAGGLLVGAVGFRTVREVRSRKPARG